MREHDTPVEVAPGVHHILLGLPGQGLTVNVFALRDADGRFCLIDTGWRNSMYLSVIDDGLRALGGSLEDVAQVIVTHGHPDHAGGASAIQQVANCTVFLGRDDEPLLARMRGGPRGMPGMQEFRSLFDRHGMSTPEMMDQTHWQFTGIPTLEEPETRIEHPPDVLESVGLEVVWTPGHSPGHACYWMPSEEILFCGDHVLPRITPNVQMMDQTNLDANPLGDYLTSLDKVLHYPAKRGLPAHGDMMDDLHGRVKEILHHHDERTQEMMSAFAKGRASAVDVASVVSWKPGRFDDLNMGAQRMAVGETLAHLRYLVSTGTIREAVGADDRIWFELA